MSTTYFAVAENIFAPTQVAAPNVIGVDFTSNTLSLTDSAVVSHHIKPANSVLLLTHEATTETLYFLPALNSLALIQSVVNTGTLNITAGNLLSFTQNAHVTLHVESIGNQLNLQQSVYAGKPINVTVSTDLSGEEADIEAGRRRRHMVQSCNCM